MSAFVPVLPDSAPFTAEQRAYLNGFFAGLYSRGPAAVGQPGPGTMPALTPLTILFGSQTGTAEGLARRLAREAGKHGFAANLYDLAKYPATQLAAARQLLIVTSTYGDGEPPDNARAFWEFLSGDSAPSLAEVRFSVCALGDTNYPKFCGFGKAVDERLEKLGAQRVSPRTDCDLDYEEPFAKWMNEVLGAMAKKCSPSEASGGPPETSATDVQFAEMSAAISHHELEDSTVCSRRREEAEIVEARSLRLLTSAATIVVEKCAAEPRGLPAYSRSNPFPAPLLSNRRLNAPGSAKETRHFEFSLEGSGLSYEAGDALGVFPTNCPELVREIIRALDGRPTDPVPGTDGSTVSLHEALLGHYDITKIPTALLQAVAARTGDVGLLKLTSPGVNGELAKFLWGREIIDLLLAFPAVKWAPEEFVKLLKKLQPRLYSISSSPKAHPVQVHLTTAIVRYHSLGRARRGVCSTFLAERVAPGAPVPVFVHSNKAFRPPADPDAPMIMVGPGTGIAPFRAFLEERRVIGAKGRNWLFFGEQHAATDFLYREELETLHRDGLLTRLDTAFSRDQADKVYVQSRMLEHARELFAWLEEGAHFYVCGDARRMAKDVDAALHEVILRGAGKTEEQSAEYVARLKSERRYQRDVY
ncbi:MAG TPA: sulfite reductase subunit alpha [Verrucomicrobiae bacterium]|nr:sulfite reductase subunit alpha [Verrucomicrobiae bacterium]